jgi:HK97 family phage major capsid protein
MEKEEMKALFGEELKELKSVLVNQTEETIKTLKEDFKADMLKQFEGVLTQKQLDAAMEKMSREMSKEIEAMKDAKPEVEKSFRDALAEKIADIDEVLKGSKKSYIPTTRKSVSSANFSADTMAYRESGVGQIQRGMEYVRNLFTIVPLGANTHDTVAWYEQLAVTNNAKNVAEIRTAGVQSNLTWIQKTLSSARMFDYIKVGVDRIKDVDFVMGEIRALITKNMKLKENDQLINGTGVGNEVKGILAYATEFVTTGIQIANANFIDLMGKIKTQVTIDMLGGATPNSAIAYPTDIDEIRYKKDTLGRYLFESWALGNSDVKIGGMTIVENPLVAENTLLAGDLSLATLYVWDDLVIEMGRTEDDMLTGLITITAYIRENLRVKDVDKKAIVKVTDLAQTISDISIPQA